MFDYRRVDVRLSDREIFRVLYEQHPISQAQIAEQLGISSKTVERAILRFKRMGYVEQLTAGNRKAAEYEFNIHNLPESVRDSIIAKQK